MNASDPLYMLVGQVSVDEHPTDYGQGSFLGKDGCHVLTNFHVAFMDGANEKGEQQFVSASVGRSVIFSFNPTVEGRFQNVVRGKVVDFGNWMRSGMYSGRTRDLALIRLDECQKGIQSLSFDPTALSKEIPDDKLSVLSLVRGPSGKNVVALEEGCEAYRFTPAIGLMYATCVSEPGMSASLFLRRDKIGKYFVVAIGSGGRALPDGREV